MQILNVIRRMIASFFCVIASVVGLLGLLLLKIGTDFVELAFKITPNDCD